MEQLSLFNLELQDPLSQEQKKIKETVHNLRRGLFARLDYLSLEIGQIHKRLNEIENSINNKKQDRSKIFEIPIKCDSLF